MSPGDGGLRLAGAVHTVEKESWTREELRKRYRKLLRIFWRLSAEQRQPVAFAPRNAEQAYLNYFCTDLAVEQNNGELSQSPDNIFLQDSIVRETRLLPAASDWDGSLFDVDIVVRLRPAPFLAGTRITRLGAALRVGFDGAASVVKLAMDLWSRRHDFVAKPASVDKLPRRGRSGDRPFLALVRFVFGFFGSHKVDARTNP